MVKKGGIRVVSEDEAYVPVFGQQEIEIPSLLAEQTNRGMKLVSTLTKNGNISHRKKKPSIKLIPVGDVTTPIVSNSVVGRFSIKDFIKTQRHILETMIESFDDLQEEVDEKVEEVMTSPPVQLMIANYPHNKEEVKAEIEELVEEEIVNEIIHNEKPKTAKQIIAEINKKLVNPTPASPKSKKSQKQSEPKKKKMTYGEITATINSLEHQMGEIVDKEKPLMRKRLDELHKNGEIPKKRFVQLHSYFTNNDFKEDYRRFSPALTKTPTPENRYVFQNEGLISKTTADKYYALESQRDALYTEFNLRKGKAKPNK
jgi:ribosomal protein L19E